MVLRVKHIGKIIKKIMVYIKIAYHNLTAYTLCQNGTNLLLIQVKMLHGIRAAVVYQIRHQMPSFQKVNEMVYS